MSSTKITSSSLSIMSKKVITKTDPRHLKRIKIIQNLFAYSFRNKDKVNLPYPTNKKTKLIIKEINKIDSLINKYAEKYPIEKIAKADLAVLRWAIYELGQKKLPIKVIIDEAVELGKEFGGDRSFAFVNAILGKVLSFYERQN